MCAYVWMYVWMYVWVYVCIYARRYAYIEQNKIEKTFVSILVGCCYCIFWEGSINIDFHYANTAPICTIHNCVCAPVLQKERERDRNKTDPILLILNISLSPSVNLTSQWTCPYFISFLDDSFLSNIAIFNGYVSLPDCQLQSIQRALRIEWLGLPPERYNPHRRQDAWSGWSLLSYII